MPSLFTSPAPVSYVKKNIFRDGNLSFSSPVDEHKKRKCEASWKKFVLAQIFVIRKTCFVVVHKSLLADIGSSERLHLNFNFKFFNFHEGAEEKKNLTSPLFKLANSHEIWLNLIITVEAKIIKTSDTWLLSGMDGNEKWLLNFAYYDGWCMAMNRCSMYESD